MLIRLKVDGFKNLIGVDIRFGPFTCIAGVNGVGKSNLFDAIQFLSALADKPLIDAAIGVRDEKGKSGDVHSLFHRVENRYTNEITFEADMIVPSRGVDDLGQEAKASITFLKYKLTIRYQDDENLTLNDRLEITHEELDRINLQNAKGNLLFDHSKKWRDSVIKGRRVQPFISTEINKDGSKVILRHQDGVGGRPLRRLASSLPRTVLSSSTAAESPTALLARREMQSWRLLQLEPSALRLPDSFNSPIHIGSDGSHLASTLYHLAHPRMNGDRKIVETRTYSQVANRLTNLIDDINRIWVERDEKRELFVLYAEGRDETPIPARSLSDGTLRFLALSVLEHDPDAQGLICLEEPENGIHPNRIKAMVDLLQDITVDVNEPIDETNPLRQVIINTHSPALVGLVPEDSLLMAELSPVHKDGLKYFRANFKCLTDTWRSKIPESTKDSIISKGKLQSYLSTFPIEEDEKTDVKPARRVAERDDVKQLFLWDTHA